MDSRLEKYHSYYNGHKSNYQRNNQYRRNNYDVRPKYVKFKSPRTQKDKYMRRNEWKYKGNCNSFKFRNGVNEFVRKINSSPEDIEEEERKKKLSETANKLLNKIKSWSAEKKDTLEPEGDRNTSPENVTRNSNEQCHNENIDKTSSNIKENTLSKDDEGKPKRIAHSKSKGLQTNIKNVSKIVSNVTETCSKSKKYRVNRASVKDFQKRIQHKLINDLMQMPKENLQNVLNDPKINPLMELKMSRLVKENKPLIAQKLRAIAESKISLNGNSKGSELFLNIDKLIDPIIETDLSVFPYELIKQMENVFQVQFDYSKNTSNSESETQNYDVNYDRDTLIESNCDEVEESLEFVDENNIEFVRDCSELINQEEADKTVAKVKDEIFNTLQTNTNILGKVNVHKLDLNISEYNSFCRSPDSMSFEDVMMYECSTEEDEDPILKPTDFKEFESNNQENTDYKIYLTPQSNFKNNSVDIVLNKVEKNKMNKEAIRVNKKRKLNQNGSSYKKKPRNHIKNKRLNQKSEITNSVQINPITIENSHNSVHNVQQSEDVPENDNQKLTLTSNSNNSYETLPDNLRNSSFTPPKKIVSTSVQTENNLKEAGVQTLSQICVQNTLYDIPLPRIPLDNSPASLLEEVNSIQNLINRLNERRFMIFLELSKSNSSVNFTPDQFSNVSLIETISNGNIYLLNTLRKYFVDSQSNLSKNN